MKHNKGILFSIVNVFAIVILPVLLVLSILLTILTTPAFYAYVLKHTDFIDIFVKAKNLEITQAIQDEIDKKVGLASYALTYQAIKKQYEEAIKAYEIINKTKEYEKLQKQYEEIKSLHYNDVKAAFPNEEAFKQNKIAEMEKLQKQIETIETYRKEHKEDIKAAQITLEELEDRFNEAQELYNEKQEEANEIIQKHRSTFAAQLNDDLEILKPVLTTIINEKFIDQKLLPLIEKYTTFFTSYDTIKSEYILELTNSSNPLYPQKVTQILLPDITISLWINDNGQQKHLISDILVEEIKKTQNLKNKVFFIAVFKFADTAIGEWLANSYIKKAGLWYSNGTIYKHNIILTGNTAELIIPLIQFLSYSSYIVYVTVICVISYLLFIIISSVERVKKILWLKRFFMYPSVVIASIALITLCAPIVLIQPSENISVLFVYLLRQVTCNALVGLLAPAIGLLLILFLCGLLFRKKYISMQQ